MSRQGDDRTPDTCPAERRRPVSVSVIDYARHTTPEPHTDSDRSRHFLLGLLLPYGYIFASKLVINFLPLPDGLRFMVGWTAFLGFFALLPLMGIGRRSSSYWAGLAVAALFMPIVGVVWLALTCGGIGRL